MPRQKSRRIQHYLGAALIHVTPRSFMLFPRQNHLEKAVYGYSRDTITNSEESFIKATKPSQKLLHTNNKSPSTGLPLTRRSCNQTTSYNDMPNDRHANVTFFLKKEQRCTPIKVLQPSERVGRYVTQKSHHDDSSSRTQPSTMPHSFLPRKIVWSRVVWKERATCQ